MSIETKRAESVSIDRERSRDGLLLGATSEESPTLSIVMPTLNEEEGIEQCIRWVKEALEELQVTGEVIISDSSTDRTPEIAKQCGAIVVQPDEPGYGYAYRYAFERTRGEYVVIGDADTTYDFRELPKLFERISSGDADLVMGTRLGGEIEPGAMPALHQHVGNPLLTWFLNLFYDAGVSDAHSGFRIISRDALDTMDLESDGMEFASEMIMEAGAKDLEIAEVPITYHERVGEATLESFSDGWRHVRFMLVNAPGYLFSVPGMVLAVLGTALLGLGSADVSLLGYEPGIHSMVAGSLLMIVGFQIGSFGYLASLAADPINEPEDRLTSWVSKHFSLERMLLLGGGLLGVGLGTTAAMLYRWFASGFTVLPVLWIDIVAVTAIVLGLQMVFWAFFASILSDPRTSS